MFVLCADNLRRAVLSARRVDCGAFCHGFGAPLERDLSGRVQQCMKSNKKSCFTACLASDLQLLFVCLRNFLPISPGRSKVFVCLIP